VLRYRTEILIPADRYVCLQLPPDLPEGRAVVTVQFVDAAPEPSTLTGADREIDPDHEDIEWWEEFDEGPEPLG
jgi:hypothetical protein